MNSTDLFVEETMPDGRYVIVWQGGQPSVSAHEAIQFLASSKSPNRLELWSKAHAEGPKGFAPMALRETVSDPVIVSTTFRMLYLE